MNKITRNELCKILCDELNKMHDEANDFYEVDKGGISKIADEKQMKYLCNVIINVLEYLGLYSED